MASNTFGEFFRITTFGESHGEALGVVMDGVPAGLSLCTEDFLPELARRRPGQSQVTTARVESDAPLLVSGVFEGVTTGMPITVLVHNEGQRSQDYEHLRDHIRPGHADETWAKKYGHRDHRGGGRSSGRETVSRVIAGVVARKILPDATRIIGHAKQIGPHRAESFDKDVIETNPVRCADARTAAAMVAMVTDLKAAGDSVGGLVEVLVLSPPPNLGDPVFRKLKSELAAAVMSVGAVTGFSYGVGFGAVTQLGSQYVADRQNYGGMLGGISTGETIRLEAAIKPTSSIQDVAKRGRHDPCIVPRVIPVLEAMVAIVLTDRFLAPKTSS